MVTLTTDYGTFEAETPDVAAKLAKAAARKAAVEERKIAAARETARERAMQIGYQVLSRYAERQSFPGGWTYYQTGNHYGPHTAADDDGWQHRVMLDTEWGRGSWSYYPKYEEVLGHVWNGGGFSIVLVLKDQHSEHVTCRAVGCCDGHLAFVELPGIEPGQFRPSSAASE